MCVHMCVCVLAIKCWTLTPLVPAERLRHTVLQRMPRTTSTTPSPIPPPLPPPLPLTRPHFLLYARCWALHIFFHFFFPVISSSVRQISCPCDFFVIRYCHHHAVIFHFFSGTFYGESSQVITLVANCLLVNNLEASYLSI